MLSGLVLVCRHARLAADAGWCAPVGDIRSLLRGLTAVSAAQGMAATIAECALSVAPEAAAEIRAGLSEVFEGAEEGEAAADDAGDDKAEESGDSEG